MPTSFYSQRDLDRMSMPPHGDHEICDGCVLCRSHLARRNSKTGTRSLTARTIALLLHSFIGRMASTLSATTRIL